MEIQIGKQEPEVVIEEELDIISGQSTRKKYSRFILSALSAVPWVGGVISGISAADAEKEQGEINSLQRWWLEEHRNKINELGKLIGEVLLRFEQLKDSINERIESEEYLNIVKKAFRSWDNAETKEKKEYIRNLIVNAASTQLCVDDLVRLFNDWIDLYHEMHFKVIKEIYKNPGITRGEIWDTFNSERPREDSSEADLYKMLIRDLSTGGVVRQARETDALGNFYKNRINRKHNPSSTLESAFEDTKPYVLTELGKKFVHYTMNDVVVRVGQENKAEDNIHG